MAPPAPRDSMPISRRRSTILILAIASTVLFSWTSVGDLTELLEIDELPGASRSLSGKGLGAAIQIRSIEDDGVDLLLDDDAGDKAAVEVAAAAAAAAAAAESAKVCPDCTVMKATDYWGEALVNGVTNTKLSASDCCKECKKFKPKSEDEVGCNVWVFCADKDLCQTHFGECWLKHLPHPAATSPAKTGPDVGWTTGIMKPPGEDAAVAAVRPGDDRRYHVIISAQGPATHWQSRVHYYWFQKVKKKCEAQERCDMGGFTRLLHSGSADDLMNEIPTFVAQPLPPEHPNHGYIVLNRPYAFLQWVQQVTIPERYVLMSEPDHVWLKPMPNIMVGERAAAFPFFYIEPSKKDYLSITAKFTGPISRREAEQIAPIGSAPTMMSWTDMQKVMPLWYNLSLAIHNDAEAVKAWGWVQEMYAFTIAAYNAGLRDIGLHLKLMSQPPFDTTMEPYYLLHYTYGMDYTREGVFTPGKFGEWRFDKRSYGSKPPPRRLKWPPTGMKNELVRHLVLSINEATLAIPGWDQYALTGVAQEHWDGETFLNAKVKKKRDKVEAAGTVEDPTPPHFPPHPPTPSLPTLPHKGEQTAVATTPVFIGEGAAAAAAATTQIEGDRLANSLGVGAVGGMVRQDAVEGGTAVQQ